MYLLHVFYKLDLFCTILLAIIAVIGDCVVTYTNSKIYKAVSDNLTHSVMGGLTWFIVNLKFKNIPVPVRLSEVFLCALIASLIDVDHFIAAKSLKLKDASNLQERPILHCSTIPIVVTMILLVLAQLCVSETIHRFSWILFAAFSSHHIRDATRRGLWFYRYSSTPPIPYYMYIGLTMIIPHIITCIMKWLYVEYNYLDNNTIII